MSAVMSFILLLREISREKGCCEFSEIFVSDNEMGYEGAEHLADALSMLTRIQALNLKGKLLVYKRKLVRDTMAFAKFIETF